MCVVLVAGWLSGWLAQAIAQAPLLVPEKKMEA
jgi:hypothetical protein